MRCMIALVGLVGIVASAPAWAGEIVGSGTWQSVKAEAVRGKWTASLTQSKDALQGTLTLEGSNVFTGGPVQGTLAEGQIVLGVLQQGSKVATFTGKYDGSRIAGEWSCPTVADEGVWEGDLPGVTK